MTDIDGKYRGLQVSYLALQRNFAFLVENQRRAVEKINIERDSVFSQLIALQSSLESNKSKRIADVVKLIERNEELTEEIGSVRYKFDLFKRHIKDWKDAFFQLEIYSRGLESLLQVRKFSRVDMPEKTSPMFDVTVKQELEEDLADLEV